MATTSLKQSMPPSRFYETLDLTDKKVLITGCTAGIGEQIAYRFAELDCRLILIGRREDRLQALKTELEKIYTANGCKIENPIQLYALDITDKSKVEAMAQEVGAVDILVNNAGLALGVASADEANYEDMSQMFHTNIIAAAHFTQLFGSKMKQQMSGHVVFISSVAGKDYYEGGSTYCATKYAMNGYAMAYRADIANTPIRVTTISPGIVETEFSNVRFNGDLEKAKKVYADIVPLHPEDVADQVIYAVTRPRHVQIADIMCYATNQAHAKWCVHRLGESMMSKQ